MKTEAKIKVLKASPPKATKDIKSVRLKSKRKIAPAPDAIIAMVGV